MLKSLYNLDDRRTDTETYIYYLQATSLNSENDIHGSVDTFFSHFHQYPDLVVLVGSSSYTLIEMINEKWKNVPIILCGETDYVSDFQYILSGDTNIDTPRIPVSDYKKKLNVSLIKTPSYIEETIEMMRHFMPDLKEIVFVGGENYQSREIYLKVCETMKTKYSELKLSTILAHQTSIDDLMITLQNKDNKSVGVLFSSWLTHKGYFHYANTQTNILRFINDQLPVFPLFVMDRKSCDFILGSVTLNSEEFYTELDRQIDLIFDEGKRASDIPEHTPFSTKKVVNKLSLDSHNIPMSLVADNMYVINEAKSFFEVYKYQLLAFCVIFLFVLLCVILIICYNSSKKHRRDLEEKNIYDYLLENMPVAFTRVKPIYNEVGEIEDAVIVHANAAFRESVGVKYNPIGSLYSRVNPGRLCQLVEATKGNVIIYKSDKDRYLELVSKSLDPTKYLDTFGIDITELQRSKVKAEVSDMMKSRFLANMSHEIRTPLNAILGFAELMNVDGNEFSDEEYTMFNNLIHKNGQILLNIIDDVLDLSLIESGHYTINIKEIDVNAMCEDSVMSLRNKAFEGVELKFERTYEYLYATGDAKRVQQVLMQLIGNALKHTQQGSVTVSYDFVGIDKIRINVTDTGEGILADDLPHIFERFYKGATFAQGTGLGLTICKILVDLWGGEIGVDSREGEGSCFWFTIKV
jgi:signal transduction histidine kinase